MKRKPLTPVTIALAILLGNCTACNTKPEPTTNETAPSRNADGTDSEPKEEDQNAGAQANSTGNKKLCEIVTRDDLQKISGVEYATTTSQADFANIKHCEYRSADVKFDISLTLALGATAQERMEQNQNVPGAKPIAGFGDQATWEPAQGTFTARFGDRCVDIKISKPHGDDQKRIDYAKEIAKLVLDRT